MRLAGFMVGLSSVGLGLALHGGELAMSVDPAVIQLGESAQLKLEFVNAQPDQVPALPVVPNLQVSYRGPSHSIQIINGRQTVSVVLSYALTPTEAGDYTIPALRLKVRSEWLTAAAVKLKVLKPGEPAPGVEGQGRLAFIRLAIPRTEAFVGEVLPLEIAMYHAVPAADLHLQPLTGEGFTFGKTRELPQQRVRSGNTVYFLHQLQGTAVANKTGDLALGPAECTAVLEVPPARRRSNDPFEDFFQNDFFLGLRAERRQVKLKSDPVMVRVLPLPPESGARHFIGAVGQFSLQVTAAPTNVAVGEPIRLKVRIEGKGALENINLPSLDSWRDFTTYPPVASVETTDPLGVEGAKVFQFDVVPQNIGLRELPALHYTFFAPDQKQYQALTHAPIPIIVRPGSGAQPWASALPAAGSPTEPVRDIVHLKMRLGAVGALTVPLILHPWFLALQAVPVLAWLTSLAWRRRLDHLARHPRLVRRQNVARLVVRGLAELARQAAANEAEQFFALTFRLLQEQIGERLDLPAAAITDAVIEEQLEPRGTPVELNEHLQELFQACNQQRYAPAASQADLAALVPKLKETLDQVRRLEF
jgi:hypothetical protein